MSTKINPPEGSVLKNLVDKWHESLKASMCDFDNPKTRHVNESNFMRLEPRRWKWPLHLFRAHVALPQIEQDDGPEAVRALLSTPNTLDRYCHLLSQQMYRDATAKTRNAPRPDNRSAVEVIVLSLLLCRFDSTKSLNANYNRVATMLGIKRGVVRGIFLARWDDISYGPNVIHARLAFHYALKFIDANLSTASVRNTASISRLPTNKCAAHA